MTENSNEQKVPDVPALDPITAMQADLTKLKEQAAALETANKKLIEQLAGVLESNGKLIAMINTGTQAAVIPPAASAPDPVDMLIRELTERSVLMPAPPAGS